jgi:hypothetical protein
MVLELRSSEREIEELEGAYLIYTGQQIRQEHFTRQDRHID